MVKHYSGPNYWFMMNLMYLNLKRDEFLKEELMEITGDWVSSKPEVYSRRVIGWY